MKTTLNDNKLTIIQAGQVKEYKTKKEYNKAKLNLLVSVPGVFFPYSRYKEAFK